MSEEKVFAEEIKALGDKIAALTLKDAKALSDYLEEGKISRFMFMKAL